MNYENIYKGGIKRCGILNSKIEPISFQQYSLGYH